MNRDSPPRQSHLNPHPVLDRYYSNEAQRPAFVQGLFDTTAGHYDHVNGLMSLGSGRWYRRRTLAQAGLRSGMTVLDVATGTGLVAREALALGSEVVGLDLSMGMLHQARHQLTLPLVQGTAEQLPFAGDQFDFLTMGYALRHARDLNELFAEFYRVLAAPGTVLILEITRPTNPWGRRLLGLYLDRWVPLVGRWTTGQRHAATLMHYYWDTIDHCVAPGVITAALARAGFEGVQCQVQLGIFRAYQGLKGPGMPGV
ncbi:MAG: class I SAM-dependent methyltransferase [Candidatus Competibacterales bacterium]